jgi:L-lactate dehydrogenase complex protein LldG
MSSAARERIFARLRAAGAHTTEVPEAAVPQAVPVMSVQEKIDRLAQLMTAMRTEVHTVDRDGWTDRLSALAKEKGWKNLLYGPASPIGGDIEKAWQAGGKDLPELVAYADDVETFKERLFSSIDAGITSTVGAIAETGAVILWPTPAEPRLMSLVPPVHIAVVDADDIYGSFAETMAAGGWAGKMPTNALLISGPSKTADIEFTLVFGVHGPKEMVVIIKK